MVKLIDICIANHRNSCERDNTLVVVIGSGLENVEGFDFETEVVCC